MSKKKNLCKKKKILLELIGIGVRTLQKKFEKNSLKNVEASPFYMNLP